MAKVTVNYSQYDKYVMCENCSHVEHYKDAWTAKAVEIGHCPTCAAPLKYHKLVLGRWKHTYIKKFWNSTDIKEFETYDTAADEIDDKLEERDM